MAEADNACVACADGVGGVGDVGGADGGGGATKCVSAERASWFPQLQWFPQLRPAAPGPPAHAGVRQQVKRCHQ